MAQQLITDFVAENKPSRSFYVYQSTIRMLNQQQDPDFNELVKEIDHIIVHYYFSSPPALGSFKNSLFTGNYEPLLEFKRSDENVNLFLDESGKKEQFLLFIEAEKHIILVELKGKPNLAYFSSIQQIDISQFENILGGFLLQNEPKD